MKTNIHFVTGYHGHVGKSTFATVLSYCLEQANRTVRLVDGDYQKQTLTKIYGADNVGQVVFTNDPDFSDSPDEILAIAQESPGADIVVDLAADTDRHLNQWLGDRGLLDVSAEEGLSLHKWWVSDRDYDSLSELSRLSKSDEMKSVDYVLVKSHYVGRKELWASTEKTHKDLKSAYRKGLKRVSFYRGYGNLVAKAQQSKHSWVELMADSEFKLENRLNQASFRKWLDKNTAAITAVYDLTPTKKKLKAG